MWSSSLPSSEALNETFQGVNGIITAVNKNKKLTAIITDTISPTDIRALATVAEKRGVNILDAPISGGPYKAEDATLTIMVGGKKEVFEDCLEILRVLGRDIFYVGSIGCGNIVKLVNNLFSLSNVTALCEGIILGVKAGVDIRTLQKVIMTSTGRSFALLWSGSCRTL